VDQETYEVVAFFVAFTGLIVLTCAVGVAAVIRRR